MAKKSSAFESFLYNRVKAKKSQKEGKVHYRKAAEEKEKQRLDEEIPKVSEPRPKSREQPLNKREAGRQRRSMDTEVGRRVREPLFTGDSGELRPRAQDRESESAEPPVAESLDPMPDYDGYTEQTEYGEYDSYEDEEISYPEDEVEDVPSGEEVYLDEEEKPSGLGKFFSPFSIARKKREAMRERNLAFNLPFGLGTLDFDGMFKAREGPKEEILTSPFHKPFKYSTEHPVETIIIFIILTMFFLFSAINIKPDLENMPPYAVEHKLNIKGEMEVYLPAGHPATEDLNEVREYWSTDMIVIYVEIESPDEYPINISSPDVLREMSYIESTMDKDREDRGVNDDCIFALSFSTIIKEVNSTPPRLYDSLLKNTADFVESYTGIRVPYDVISGAIDLNATGDYAIPDQQERIDMVAENMPSNLVKKLVADTNDDGIWDAGVIVIGISEEADPGEMIKLVDKVIGERPNKQTNMVVTGPVPLTDFITKESFRYYGKVMPVASILVVIGIFAFHRAARAVFIAGLPTGCAVAWIYGTIALLKMPVTPTIIVLGPILLALGVSYGLHLANRISQEPDDNPVIRAQKALATTGNAVLMSAITTMIGFVSLAFGSLMPVTTVGISLTIGIFYCFILAMFMSPALAILMDYRKPQAGMGKKMAKVATLPTKHSKKIMGVFLAALLASVFIFLPLIETDTNIVKMAPSDPSINGYDKIRTILTYSEKFDSGALGMSMVEGKPGRAFRSDNYEDDSKSPVELLDDVEVIENDINDIVLENPELPVNAISIVTIMKTIGLGGTVNFETILDPLPDFLAELILEVLPEGITELNLSDSQNFWGLLHSPVVMQSRGLQKYLLNVFYDSLSIESRGMLINEFLDPTAEDYYTKTLIYVDMPILTDQQTHDAVFKVNDVVERNYVYVEPTQLTGFAAVAVAINDLLIESQKFTLILSIILVFFTLSIVFKDKGPWWKWNFKLGGLTTLPVVMVVALEPIVMILADVSLNLATVMIGSTVIGAGVDFSVHITQRMKERGMNIKSVENSVEKSGMALIEATGITVLGLCAAFLIPISAIYNFVLVIMVLLVLSAVAAMFLLPAFFILIIKSRKESDDSSY